MSSSLDSTGPGLVAGRVAVRDDGRRRPSSSARPGPTPHARSIPAAHRHAGARAHARGTGRVAGRAHPRQRVLSHQGAQAARTLRLPGTLRRRCRPHAHCRRPAAPLRAAGRARHRSGDRRRDHPVRRGPTHLRGRRVRPAHLLPGSGNRRQSGATTGSSGGSSSLSRPTPSCSASTTHCSSGMAARCVSRIGRAVARAVCARDAHTPASRSRLGSPALNP